MQCQFNGPNDAQKCTQWYPPQKLTFISLSMKWSSLFFLTNTRNFSRNSAWRGHFINECLCNHGNCRWLAGFEHQQEHALRVDNQSLLGIDLFRFRSHSLTETLMPGSGVCYVNPRCHTTDVLPTSGINPENSKQWSRSNLCKTILDTWSIRYRDTW